MRKSALQIIKRSIFSALIAMVCIAIPQDIFARGGGCDNRAFNIKVSEKITIDDLLNQLGSECEYSVFVKDEIAKNKIKEELSSINLKNMTLQDIFDVVLVESDLYYTFENNILKISALETKTFKVDYINSIRTGEATMNASVQGSEDEGGTSAANDGHSIIVNENFDFWPTIAVEITSILNNGTSSYTAQAPIINQNSGLITVTATKRQLKDVENYLDMLEGRLHRQVILDVSIISVELSDSKTKGVNWSEFNLALNDSEATTADNSLNLRSTGVDLASLATTKTYVFDNTLRFTMSALLDFLEAQGRTSIKSNPKILTMNNQQALISVGDKVNYLLVEDTEVSDSGVVTESYEEESVFIGILLNITPQISDNGEIILRINPSVTNFSDSTDSAGGSTTTRDIAPDTEEKKLSTVVKVKDGDTIIMGGLISSKLTNTENGIIGLKSLPVLGALFRSKGIIKTNEELIFVVTPRIVKNNKTHADFNNRASLKELGYSRLLNE